MGKKFKYQQYLDKYKNCPPKDFVERDFPCVRWVHKEPSELNFKPLPLIRSVAPRILDDNDIACKSYSLSLFKDLDSARIAYKRRCNNSHREDFLAKFKNDVGENAAQLHIDKNDGVADRPHNITGHISFYEYTDCKLLEKIAGIFDIFV